ncbi:MAG: SDR family NAD(P)-dependent oxidoreductase, partial [Ilumatobacteraceae bacterium]
RLAVVAATTAQLRDRLHEFATTGEAPVAVTGRAARPRVAFLFTGQGAQYAGMAKALYDAEPVFHDSVDRCAELMDPLLDQPLLPVIFAEPGSSAALLLDQTAYTQPALFAVEFALVQLWQSWGIVPDALLGHSVGELVAAAVAGVFSLDDASRLVVARGALMQALPAGGAMLAVFAAEADVESVVAAHPQVAIAAVNGPEHTVVSGDGVAVAAIAEVFTSRGVRVQPLTVSHAFHSPLMQPMLAAFRVVAESVQYNPQHKPVMSNVTGAVAGAELATAAYWVQHVMAPVRFADGMAALHESGTDVFVEIGPHPVLTGMGQSCIPADGAAWAPSLRRNRNDVEHVLAAAATLFVHGAKVNWRAVRDGGDRTTLPTYPFQRHRCWIEPAPVARRGHTGGHPLLGVTTSAPALRATIHETSISVHSPSWLDGHRLGGTAVFPGSAFAEMVLAAIDPAIDVVASLQIREALVLPDDGEVRLQTIIVEQGDVREVQIVSVEATDGSARSRLHAVAVVTRAAPLPAAAAVDIDALVATFGDDVDVDDYYARLREAGLTYGRAFRGLTRLLQGGACALGHAELPVDVTDATRYRLHPALFDACFHVLGAAMASGRDPTDDDMYVPIAMDGLRLHRSGATSVWCAASLLDTSHDASSVTAKVDVYGADGELVASVDRLEVRRTTRAMWERGLTKASSLLHEVVWRECRRTVPAPTDRPAGRWVIVADTVEAAQPLVDRLREGGAQRVVVIDADAPDEAGLGVALDNLVSGDTSGQLGVVSMNGIEIGRLASATGANGQVAALERTVRGPLALARWLAEHAAGDAQLWLITRGAQSVGGEPRSLAGAAVWGLGRVVANEHPELACTCIDLDPAGDDAAFDELAAELLTGHPGGRPGEDQLAYRGRIRMVPRLVRFDGAATSPPPMPFRLVVADRGSFEHMSYAPLVRRSPDAGEIEIEVRATGVNFRDVLNVLGMYPGEAGDPGLECAGVVTAVGGGVSGLAIGDAVFGIAPRAYDSHVVTRADLVVRKPDKLTFAEAAGSTIAFLTAAFGLETLAGLRAGEKVLIHAAAGGVGLAAVGIAHRIGAEVFATVGSAEKRSMLADLGVKHIYSSRTLDFADEILADTGGAGVDVVLNSLSDEFVERSFQVLTPTGRFLEIGKGGTWSTERAAQARPHGSYHEYDLSDLLVEDAQGVRAGLAELVDDIDADRAAPLPVSAYAAEAVQSAFRFMAEAGHIGKLVVTHRADAPRIRSDGSYLVTGGLGGLGLEVARWLVEQGARHVTLAGRSAASPEAAERIVAMEAAGATVRVVQGDVADAGDVRRIVDASVASGVPLRGVFHAAGVVDDGVLEQQTSQRFAAVFAPKVLGAAHLDEATRDADLDHFVLFSSASALLGAPGQSNYAAANSALDAVAARRRALGLPALSINWGAWGEVGMAARLPSRERQRLADRGIGLLSTSTALDALGQLMDHDAANVAVLDVDWPLLAAHAGDAGSPALLHELTAGPRIDHSRSAGAGSGLLASLVDAEPHARLALVVAHVHEHVARVLGLAADEVLDHDDELAALGLDSLMAVELTNRLRSATGLTLSTTVAFDHPSISALADHLAEALGHLPASGEHVTSHHSEHGPVAVGRDRALPASSAQYRLLFVDQFAPGLAIYNLPMVLRIRGPVDADAVRVAVVSLVRRHEALRTNFAFVDGGWVQQIVAPDAASVPFTIEEGGGDPDAFAIRLRTEGARPFDLAADVKMRCVLFSMSPDEHVLALTFHHIAADGWSVTRLIVEFAELYSAAVENRPPQLAELPLRYSDWSAWQHEVEDE